MDVKSGYKQTDVGVIPKDWRVESLGNIFNFSGGLSASRAQLGDSGYCYLHYGDIHTSSKSYVDLDAQYRDLPRLDIRLSDVSRKSILLDGDVVFVDASEDDDGASKHQVIRNPRNIPFISGLHTIVAKSKRDDLTNSYKTHCFQTRSVKSQFLFYSVGTKVTGISKTNIAKILLLIPPVAEQEAIAEALSDADIYIESMEQLIAKKRQIKQGAMQELLTGKKRLPGFSGEWEEIHLGDRAIFYKGRGLPKSALDPFGKEPCIHYGELFTQYPETIRNIVSRTNSSKDSFRSVANDVLMPTSDVTPNGLAKASCLCDDGIILGGDILVIRTNKNDICGSFLSFVIRYSKDQILQLVTGTTVYHLYAADMKKFTLLLPSIKEQQDIINVLDDMDAEIDALETKLAKARQIKQGMMQELLTGRIRLI